MVYSYLKTSSYNYQCIVPFLLVVSIAWNPKARLQVQHAQIRSIFQMKNLNTSSWKLHKYDTPLVTYTIFQYIHQYIYIRVIFPPKNQSHSKHPKKRVFLTTGGGSTTVTNDVDEDSFNGITLDVPGFVGIGLPWRPPWCCTFGEFLTKWPCLDWHHFWGGNEDENRRKKKRWVKQWEVYSWWSSMLYIIYIYICNICLYIMIYACVNSTIW